MISISSQSLRGVFLLLSVIPEVDVINFRDRQFGETGSGSGLPNQPFPDPASPNQASPTRFPLAGLLESRKAVPLMLGALRRRAKQAAMRFAGPPRVDATQYVRVLAPTCHDTRL